MEGPKRTIGEVFGKDACNNDYSDVNAAAAAATADSEWEQEIGLTMPSFDDDFNDLSSQMSTLVEQPESPVHLPFHGSGLDFGGAFTFTVGSTGSLPAAQGFGSNDGVGGSFGTGPRNNAITPHLRQRRLNHGRTIIDSVSMDEDSENMDMNNGGGDGSDNGRDGGDDATYEYDTETDSETYTDDVEGEDDSDSNSDSDNSGGDNDGGPDYMDDDGAYSGDDYGYDEPPRTVLIEFGGRMIEAMPIYLPPPSPDRPFIFEDDDTEEESNLEVQEASTQQPAPTVP